MTDSKTSLAAAEAAIQEAEAALDAERADYAAKLADAAANAAALGDSLAKMSAECDALKAQIAALKPDPWAAIDKTGKTVVNAALQTRLDAGDDIPVGRYLIDPTDPPIILHDCDGAVDALGKPVTFFVVKPSATPKDYAYKVVGKGITVRNIRVVGDRMANAETAGSTNEWGYGGMVTGEGATLENCYSELCMGDGFGIAAKNVTVRNCIADRNRRQGLSGFNCDGLLIEGGEYTNTGAVTVDGVTDEAAPNGPCAGIDIEPDAPAPGQPPPTVSVLIKGAKITGNRAGVLGWLRSEVGGALNITVKDCDIGANANGVQGKALAGKVSMTVTGNRFAGNRSSNVRAESGSTANVTGNASTGLASRYALQAVGPSPLPPGVIVASANTYA